jgi:hypothetical protein
MRSSGEGARRRRARVRITLGDSREPPVLRVSSCSRAERNDARYYAHATKRLPSRAMLARAQRLLV